MWERVHGSETRLDRNRDSNVHRNVDYARTGLREDFKIDMKLIEA